MKLNGRAEHVFSKHVDNLSIWMATHEQSLQVYAVYSQRSAVCGLESPVFSLSIAV